MAAAGSLQGNAECLRTHQFFGPHVVKNPFCVLTVVPALHDRQEQLRSVVLKGRKNNISHCQEPKAEHTQPQLPHTLPRRASDASFFLLLSKPYLSWNTKLTTQVLSQTEVLRLVHTALFCVKSTAALLHAFSSTVVQLSTTGDSVD